VLLPAFGKVNRIDESWPHLNRIYRKCLMLVCSPVAQDEARRITANIAKSG
jgi:hypothetical protein